MKFYNKYGTIFDHYFDAKVDDLFGKDPISKITAVPKNYTHIVDTYTEPSELEKIHDVNTQSNILDMITKDKVLTNDEIDVLLGMLGKEDTRISEEDFIENIMSGITLSTEEYDQISNAVAKLESESETKNALELILNKSSTAINNAIHDDRFRVEMSNPGFIKGIINGFMKNIKK